MPAENIKIIIGATPPPQHKIIEAALPPHPTEPSAHTQKKRGQQQVTKDFEMTNMAYRIEELLHRVVKVAVKRLVNTEEHHVLLRHDEFRFRLDEGDRNRGREARVVVWREVRNYAKQHNDSIKYGIAQE